MYSLISFLAWTGLIRAIHEGRDGAIVLAIPLICFPLVYYLTHPEIRFRHPIDPIVVIMLVSGAMSFFGKKEESPTSATHSRVLDESSAG
jgi:hypothetical protein